jgi:hypothetical protein
MIAAGRAAAARQNIKVVAAAAQEAADAVAAGLLHAVHDGLGPDRVQETLQVRNQLIGSWTPAADFKFDVTRTICQLHQHSGMSLMLL